MCSRGVFQLRKLSIFFCDFGGSSTGVRDAITSDQFKSFMHNNEHIDFNFICKRNNHPFLRGAYINGYIKDVPLRNKKPQQIESILTAMRNQFGRKAIKASGNRIYGAKESIQGKWEPNMFNKYPQAQVEKIYNFPKLQEVEKEKQVERKVPNRDPDMLTQALRMKEFINPHNDQV